MAKSKSYQQEYKLVNYIQTDISNYFKAVPKITMNRRSSRISNIKFPLQMPSYESSRDSDEEIVTQQIKAKRQKRKQSTPSVKKRKVLEVEWSTDSTIIAISDSDFEPTKSQKEKTLLNHDPLSKREITKKVESYLENCVIHNIPEVHKKRDSTATSTQQTTVIGVHKPSPIQTIPSPKKHRLLQERIDNISLYVTANENDIMQNLNMSLESTVIYQETSVLTNNPPTKKITILDNIICSTPLRKQIAINECKLSPIPKKKVHPGGTTIQNQPHQSCSKENSSPAKMHKSAQGQTLHNSNLASPLGSDSHPKDTILADKKENKKPTKNCENKHDEVLAKWITKVMQKIVIYVQSQPHLFEMLTSAEKSILRNLFNVRNPCYLFLCFKLFTRMQKWQNILKLRSEIGLQLSDSEVGDMYRYLHSNQFVDIDYSEEPCIDLLNLLTKPDLKNLCQSFKLKVTNEIKANLIQRLLDNCQRQATLTFTKSTEKILKDRITQKLGLCVKLNPVLYKLLKKLHILYSFTSNDFLTASDLHYFIVKIINKDIFMPKINIEDFKMFDSIEEFTKFSDAFECYQAVIQSRDKKEYRDLEELCQLAYRCLQDILAQHEKPRPVYLMRFTAGHKYVEALNLGAKHLTKHCPERVAEWLTCLIDQNKHSVYRRGRWYNLLIMVQYHYLKEHQTAANTMIEALSSKDISEVHRYDLSYRAEAIKRNKKYKIDELLSNKISFLQPKPLREPPSAEIEARAIRDSNKKGKRLYLEKTDAGCMIPNVENVAINHYSENGYPKAVHCEGQLLATILFLLFWDVIYESPVKKVFIHEIQYVPLDLGTSEFYINRKEEIDRRLEEIEHKWPNDQLKIFLCNNWSEHASEKSHIRGELVSKPEELHEVILCIGRLKLAKMLERIIKVCRCHYSGLPDLFLWNLQEKKCKFVEVKGERDTLSTKQKLWLDFLLQIGADAEVCYVHTIGSNTNRRKSKPPVKSQSKT